jgi:DNA-binding MarR family transcriptional regulator
MSKIHSGAVSSPPSAAGRDMGREMATAVVLFHEAIASRLGLSATEWRCWGLLEQHGPCTAGRLAELSGFTTGAITGIVDRLERAGYARRKSNPHDRRSVLIEPLCVEQLRKKVRPIFASLTSAMGSLMAGYSPRELAAIYDYVSRTIAILREETIKLTREQQK